MADRHGKLWTTDELAAAVDAYVDMLRLQAQGAEFARSDIVSSLMEGALSGRSKKSVEFRFCNISSVLAEHSLSTVHGYRPLDHVGEGPRSVIIGLLTKRGLDLNAG